MQLAIGIWRLRQRICAANVHFIRNWRKIFHDLIWFFSVLIGFIGSRYWNEHPSDSFCPHLFNFKHISKIEEYLKLFSILAFNMVIVNSVCIEAIVCVERIWLHSSQTWYTRLHCIVISVMMMQRVYSRSITSRGTPRNSANGYFLCMYAYCSVQDLFDLLASHSVWCRRRVRTGDLTLLSVLREEIFDVINVNSSFFTIDFWMRYKENLVQTLYFCRIPSPGIQPKSSVSNDQRCMVFEVTFIRLIGGIRILK